MESWIRQQQYLLKSNCKSGNSVVVRTSLKSRENRSIDFVLIIIHDLQIIIHPKILAKAKTTKYILAKYNKKPFCNRRIPNKLGVFWCSFSYMRKKLSIIMYDTMSRRRRREEKIIFTSCPCLFTSFKPFRKNIIAPRGPRNDLWVVVVTTSANSNGLGITFAATRPLMCAMSAKRTAFCLSHTYIPENYLLKWMWKRLP